MSEIETAWLIETTRLSMARRFSGIEIALMSNPDPTIQSPFVLASDYDALAESKRIYEELYDAAQERIRELERCLDGGVDCANERITQMARIRELEAALTKIYGKASACDPSHYNQTMTEIIDIACSVSDRGSDDAEPQKR